MADIRPGIYPMYLTEKILERRMVPNTSILEYEKRQVTMYHVDDINVSDTIQYTKMDLTLSVLEVLESRDAKGNHTQPTKWFNLILEYKI